ncbi:MAG: hypothetical protein K0S47_2228 [Herbinix sp.]|nr:hypothetical protein [Herbinix sp.]
MKELIKKFSLKVFRIFQKHTILKLAGLVLVIYLLILGLKWLPTLQIKFTAPPELAQQELSTSLDTIAVDAGETLVAETETKALYIDPATLNLKVVDKATNTTWNSVHEQGTVDEKSLIKITYMGEDNTVLSWDSFTYAVENKTFQLDRIEGGVRITLDLKELDSYRINEYIPQKITIEKYETTFIKALEDKAAAGEITEDNLNKYKTALSLIYAVNDEENCYYNKYSTAPPLSIVKQLIEMTKVLNYTTEQLMADSADFGITVSIEEPANFIIPIEAKLDGDDFLVQVATDQIQNINQYYTLTRVDLFPYFGSVGPTEVADGHILVPDGAGALLNLNEFDPNFGSYSRPLYNNTYYSNFYYLNSYPENLHMPVFGMTYGKGEASTGGFMGIVEEGDETGIITATLASATEDGGGGDYNRVFASFDVTQYAQVSILGPYDSSGGRFMASTGTMDMNLNVRYKLYPTKVTYYDMAKSYKDYLVQKYNLTVHYDEKAKLYLDVTGALTLDERILGLPHDKVISMTTYNELKSIMEDLGDIPLVVNYMGIFNDGLSHKVMNRANLTRANGSKKELKELMTYAKENQQDLFLQADFSKIYENGNGFKDSIHGIYNLDNYPVLVYGYDYASGALTALSKTYHLLNPVYLTSVVDGFIKDAKSYDMLSIGDLATEYYASYRKDDIVTPTESEAIINTNLEKLTQTKTLALNNPEMNKIIYGKYASDISRESSGYGGLAEEIPFRQLVMNGLIGYTTLNVNESGTSEDYFLLQALELGSYPKFTITAENLDVLKNSFYTDYISRQYSLIGDDMKALYQKYEEAFSQINSMEITNHEIVDQNVYKTVYKNGVTVITNYNKYPVVVNDQEIEALGYLIHQ